MQRSQIRSWSPFMAYIQSNLGGLHKGCDEMYGHLQYNQSYHGGMSTPKYPRWRCLEKGARAPLEDVQAIHEMGSVQYPSTIFAKSTVTNVKSFTCLRIVISTCSQFTRDVSWITWPPIRVEVRWAKQARHHTQITPSSTQSMACYFSRAIQNQNQSIPCI